ncbi:MAG TPA: hypothetical protein VHF90_06025 [Thermoleophilaceae bacterium]|nr:hypothetical protein [Thermoleophilaceae bacterium]
MASTAPIPASKLCWWCKDPANSREHKFKRSDVVREHGKGPYTGDAKLVRVTGEGRWEMRSSKSGPLKFETSLCVRCNDTRSQPFDAAYDKFIAWLLANEELVLKQRKFDLRAIFGADWEADALNVYRFLVKHIGCRLADADDGLLPPNGVMDELIACLDGGGPVESLECSFFVESAMLRWCQMRDDDPLWVRPFAVDTMPFTKSNGQLEAVWSTWRYGWITFAWTLGPGASKHYPFRDREVPMPIVAAATAWDPWFEFALAWDPARGAEDVGDDEPHPNDQIDPESALDRSPVALAFAVGALDFEATTRHVGPDERTNGYVEDESLVEPELELQRAAMLVAACRGWAEGDLDDGRARRVAENAELSEAAALKAESDRMHAAQSDDRAESLRTAFACMATLKLSEAILADLHSQEGQDALVDVGRFAGCSVMSAAFAVSDIARGFENVAAVVAALARAEL